MSMKTLLNGLVVSAITLSDGALIKLTDGDIHRSTV